jgi:hypothetical protein
MRWQSPHAQPHLRFLANQTPSDPRTFPKAFPISIDPIPSNFHTKVLQTLPKFPCLTFLHLSVKLLVFVLPRNCFDFH